MAKQNALIRFAQSPIASVRNFLAVVDPRNRKTAPQNLNTYISPVIVERARQDILSWREAMKEAETPYNPFRVKIQQLYNDTILNGHVFACMEKRRNLTLLREWALVNQDGTEVEDLKPIFTGQWFDNFINYTLDAKFFGYSLIRIGDIVNSSITDCEIIRRTNISPDRRTVTPFPYSLGGLQFDDPEYALWHVYVSTPSEIGLSPCGYGLLYKVGLYEVYMRNLLGFNADYIETYGMPIRVAKTDKVQADPERQELENMMAMMGANGWAVLDKTDEIELIESTSARGQNNPYENLENRCMKFTSKVLLGHADALDSTPGKLGSGQGEESPVHQALENIKSVDGKFAESIVNGHLLPRMRELGFRIPDGVQFKYLNNAEKFEQRKQEDDANLKFSQVVQTLSSAGFDVDENYIVDRTGIPVAKKAPVTPAPQDFTPQMVNKLRNLYADKEAHKH